MEGDKRSLTKAEMMGGRRFGKKRATVVLLRSLPLSGPVIHLCMRNLGRVTTEVPAG